MCIYNIKEYAQRVFNDLQMYKLIARRAVAVSQQKISLLLKGLDHQTKFFLKTSVHVKAGFRISELQAAFGTIFRVTRGFLKMVYWKDFLVL
jgi:hypothetical protein